MTEDAGRGGNFSPQTGYFILPAGDTAGTVSGDTADVAASRRFFDGIQVSTITGGVPDASDQLPEGTIIVTPA